MKDERFIKITGCHECEIRKFKDFDGLRGQHEIYCNKVNGEVVKYVESKTFHPKCPLEKSRVKPLDVKVGEIITNIPGLSYLIVKVSNKNEKYYKTLCGHTGNNFAQIWESEPCENEKEAKAEAEKHWQKMITKTFE